MGRRSFGNIRKLPSGRYQARHRVDLDWVNAPGTFPTKGAADAWLAEQQVALAQGRWRDPRAAQGTRVVELVEEYITARVTDPDRPLSPATAKTYRASAARCLEGTTLGAARVDVLTVGQVRAWYNAQAARSLAEAKKAYRLLRAAYARAIDDELLPGPTPVRVKGAGSPVPSRRRVAGVAELAAVVEQVPARWQALIVLGAWAGPRWGELRGLRRRDVDLEHGTVLLAEQLDVDGVRRSTKAGHPGDDDLVHVPPHLLPVLAAHLLEHVDPDPDALLFTGTRGGPLSHSAFSKVWRVAQDAAGIDPENRLQLHDLRRTAGTWATELGGASLAVVMRRLRHRTVAAAMTYQVPDSTADRAVASRMSDARHGVSSQ